MIATYSGWSQFLLIQKAIIFDLILHDGTFSPAKIIYIKLTRYGNDINWCFCLDRISTLASS